MHRRRAANFALSRYEISLTEFILSDLFVLLIGIGEKKMKRLYDTLHTPFKSRKSEQNSSAKEETIF